MYKNEILSNVKTQVGMATNIPPHNLGELVDVLSVIIQNPEATVSNIPLPPFGSLSFNIIIVHI